MLRLNLILFAALMLLLASVCHHTSAGQAIPRPRPSVVRIEQTERGHRLTRDGEPYFIRGAGGKDHLAELVRAGGNSIRTWGADGIGPLLDQAHQLGLTVTVGLWLGHERHGFDYQDGDAVAKQLEAAKASILRYRDHPAVLMWGVGNEMEGEGNNPAVWYAVNHVARMAKELDPRHPTMTVIAELGGKKVQNLHRFCPDIDVVGINTYGGVLSVGERYVKAGGKKPYVVTEFGPPGQWEVGKTAWGAPREMSSTEKAKWYLRGYREGTAAHPDLCLGSYVFIWGAKQEATATWYGLFLADGARLGAVESMTQVWGGEASANRCPLIEALSVDRAHGLRPGDTVRASLEAADPDGDALTVKWILRRESGSYATGGDAQAAQPEFADAIVKSDARSAQVRMPRSGGGYRLFAYVYDGQGNAAVANQPLHVEGKILAPVAKVPFLVYGDAQKGQPYAPSGYMGNTGAIKMQLACSERPFRGSTCLKVEYTAADQWGGVVWQSPPDDWGDRPGGYDLTAANTLALWARGANGNEAVTFGVGIIGPDKPFQDSAKVELKDVRLTKEWQRYRIPLEGRDLSAMKSGFHWVVAAKGAPITFYLDEIQFVSEGGN